MKKTAKKSAKRKSVRLHHRKLTLKKRRAIGYQDRRTHELYLERKAWKVQSAVSA